MIASHFVIGDILRSLDADNLAETEKIFNKFAKRYHKDRHLKKIHDEFEKYLMDKSRDELKDVRKKLTDLRAYRRLEASSRGMLALKDRRHLTSFHDFDGI